MDFKGIENLITTALTLNNEMIDKSLEAIMNAPELSDAQKKEFRNVIIESKKLVGQMKFGEGSDEHNQQLIEKLTKLQAKFNPEKWAS
jgi:hypothetical protein